MWRWMRAAWSAATKGWVNPRSSVVAGAGQGDRHPAVSAGHRPGVARSAFGGVRRPRKRKLPGYVGALRERGEGSRSDTFIQPHTMP